MVVEITPNAFAFLALLAFLPLSLALFHFLRPSLALALTVGVAALPELVTVADLSGLPPIDKTFIVSSSLIVGCLYRCRGALVSALRSRAFWAFFAALVVGTLGTSVTNRDPQVFGPLVLPGLTFRDVPSMLVRDAFLIYLPFLVAKAVVRTPVALRDLMWAVVVVALAHVPLVAVELRMSPQCHDWVYGFMPQSFVQTVRGEGWRPIVFMRNGLALTLFLATAATFAAALGRARLDVLRLTPWPWAAVLAAVVALCRSLGSFVYGAVMLLVVALTRGSLARRLALALAVLVVLFPPLRTSGVFPTDRAVAIAERFSEERAQSLRFRFDNEDALLDRALLRPAFGWGGFGRARVFDDEGRDLSITDGFWIIWLGERGVVGFTLAFGLLTAPIVVAFRRTRRIGQARLRVMVEALALVVAIHAVDLLPNGLFSQLTFFFAGALWGVAQGTCPPRAASGSEHRPPVGP